MGRMKELDIQRSNRVKTLDVSDKILTLGPNGECPACDLVLAMAMADGMPTDEGFSITCKLCGRDDADIPT